jgi:DNA-binding transcriptional MerR regulator
LVNSKEKLLLGTSATYIERGEKGFAKIEMLLKATGGLSLSQVCSITGLENSTIQNWVKRGWVVHPKGKRYEEIHIARILLINALKECIKLEHITLLMRYVKGPDGDTGGDIIKESELFNYLCDALERMEHTDDLSRGGVESVVEAAIKSDSGTKPDSRIRIRKALSLMIYACVCTDVKRRTEDMMKQILRELEHPAMVEDGIEEIGKTDETENTQPVTDGGDTPRKTVSQTLREWDANDISSVERAIIDYQEESTVKPAPENVEKHSYRPWYSRKGPKRQ